MSSSTEASGLDENSEAQQISLLDHFNDFQYNPLKKSDNFVIDMNTFSHGINKDNNANSRITLQKSLSRKGSQRSGGGGSGAEKKSNSNSNNSTAIDREATLVATSSPRGTGTPEKLLVAAVESSDHLSSPQIHHQITITTSNIITNPDSKSSFRRNSFKRSSHSRAVDPKRVLLFFATLSSMGTILLIYFTLSLKYKANEGTSDYKS